MQIYEDLEDMTYLIDSLVSARDAARERADEIDDEGRLAEALTPGPTTSRRSAREHRRHLR